jgi:hypothetical protein
MLLWNLVEISWKASAASRGDFYFTLEGIYGFGLPSATTGG